MKRVQGSRSIICSKKELKALSDLFYTGWTVCHELPLFSLQPEIKDSRDVKTDYAIVRPNGRKLTQTFFDRINKAWNKMYE